MTPPFQDLGTVTPLVRRLPGAADPFLLYRELTGGRPDTFLLESADRAGGTGERSLIGVRSALRLRAGRDTISVEALSPNGDQALAWLAGDRGLPVENRRLEVPIPAGVVREEADRFRQPSPLDLLRRLAFGPQLQDEPNPWCHLLAGVIGYDAIDYFERLPAGEPDPLEQPLVEWWLPDLLVVIDHVRRSTTVIATAWGGPAFAERFHDAGRLLAGLEATIGAAGGAAVALVPGPVEAADVEVDQSDAVYAATVTRLKQHVRQGDVYQIVPSRTFRIPCADPLGAYGALRLANPSPYLFYLAGGERTLFGASPETCLRVDGATRRVAVVPIAGTAVRGRDPSGALDPDLDSRHEVALRHDPKESAEHLMLVDLARNDVARVAVPGTRAVTRLLEVERYRHVMHLVSEVSGTLAPGIDALEAFAATLPMGTLVGAPKVRAAELLREAEPSRRGWYGGGVGYLRRDGTLETAIVIRSAVVRDGVASVRAGAGVVLDSDPEAETAETRAKARAVLEAIQSVEAPVHA